MPASRREPDRYSKRDPEFQGNRCRSIARNSLPLDPLGQELQNANPSRSTPSRRSPLVTYLPRAPQRTISKKVTVAHVASRRAFSPVNDLRLEPSSNERRNLRYTVKRMDSRHFTCRKKLQRQSFRSFTRLRNDIGVNALPSEATRPVIKK